jgi:hypothetical protein
VYLSGTYSRCKTKTNKRLTWRHDDDPDDYGSPGKRGGGKLGELVAVGWLEQLRDAEPET